MSAYAAQCINCIPGIEEMSYLELGLYGGKTFNAVKAKEKVSVDINPKLPTKPTFCMTTDEFFKQNKRRFDVIFVDADHRVEQVVKDVANAMAICDKMLFIHDLYPDSEGQACEDGNWAGDGYKMLMFWITEQYYAGRYPFIHFKTLFFDNGLTVVKPPYPKCLIPGAILCSYKDFLRASSSLNFVRLNPDDFKKWIAG